MRIKLLTLLGLCAVLLALQTKPAIADEPSCEDAWHQGCADYCGCGTWPFGITCDPYDPCWYGCTSNVESQCGGGGGGPECLPNYSDCNLNYPQACCSNWCYWDSGMPAPECR